MPDEVTKSWMESEYAARVKSVIRDLRLPVAEVQYELDAAPTPASPREVESQFFHPARKQLNRKFVFDSFVVGSCNQFAHAAAVAVAANPQRATTRCLSMAAAAW